EMSKKNYTLKFKEIYFELLITIAQKDGIRHALLSLNFYDKIHAHYFYVFMNEIRPSYELNEFCHVKDYKIYIFPYMGQIIGFLFSHEIDSAGTNPESHNENAIFVHVFGTGHKFCLH
ncbi:hypothetical protein ACJX0J_033660, partial [Zea mays]